MPLLETLAAAFGLYKLLPKPMRAAVERTADVWIDQALNALGGDAIARLRGSGEARMVKQALAKAVGLSLARHPQVNAVVIASDFSRPPFSNEVTRILTDPTQEIDPERVHQAFLESRYEMGSLGVDEVELLRQIRTTFLSLLKANRATRGLWNATILERVSSDVAAIRPAVERTEVGVNQLVASQAAAHSFGPFLTPTEFFQPWMNERRLFHHAWALVGRSEQVGEIDNFLRTDEHLAAVLPGCGGIGKSRLLRSVAQGVDSGGATAVRFLAEGQPVGGQAFAGLPEGPVLLVVDDAHRRDDLDTFLALARRRPATKVLLSTRGYGVDAIRGALVRSGYDVRESTFLRELQELDRVGTLDLARQALGPSWEHLAEGLAAATGDSPLVTAIGGRLIAEEALPPGLLAQHGEFREAVLERLADEYARALHNLLEPNLARRVMEVVAAAGPVRPANAEFVRAAADFVDNPADEFVRVLDAMERGGILLRRGGTLRITPDVLADYLLGGACITGAGESTGFAERAFDAFFPVTPGPVLLNLAEMDWQVRHVRGGEVDLLAAIWLQLEEAFRSSSNYGRKQMLKLLREVALFQPLRTFELIEYAIANPSEIEDPSPFGFYSRWGHQDVVEEAPELLRRIAYQPDLRPQALDLLWQLGRGDERPLGQNPGHAVRILSELGSYDTNRLDMAVAVLDRAERWIVEPEAHDHAKSVLDVVDPMLEKAGSRMSVSGFQLSFTPYFVNPETTRAVRDRALSLVEACARSDSVRVALRGVKSLSNGLRNAMGHFSSSPSEALQARWVPEQLHILDVLAGLANASRDPLVTIAALEAVAWQACYGTEPLKPRARAIVEGVQETFEFLLTKHLTGSYRLDTLDYAEEDPEEGDGNNDFADKWQRKSAERADEMDRLAVDFVGRFPSADDGVAYLDRRLAEIVEAEDQVAPGEFLFRLSMTAPSYGERLCHAAATQSTHLKPHLAPAIGGLRSQNESAADRLIDELLGTGDPELARVVAASCGQALWDAPPATHPLEILKGLLRHADERTRWNAVHGLGILCRNDPRLAVELALVADVGTNGRLADALFQALGQRGGERYEHVDKPAVEAFLEKLVAVDSIGEWATARFLDHASRLAPADVIRLVIRRAKHARTLVDNDYRVMPYEFESSFSGFADAADRIDLLREIRDMSLDADEALEFWIPRLFAAVSSNYAEDAKIVLNEWINSGEAQKLAAAGDLLSAASPEFVLGEADFVVNAIERAHAAGDTCLKSVQSVLFGCAASRGGSGVAGEPMPYDVAARDRAAEVARTLPVGSPGRKFYELVQADAEADIRRTMERNAEIE